MCLCPERPEGSVRPTGPGGGGGCSAGKAASALTTEPSPLPVTQSRCSRTPRKVNSIISVFTFVLLKVLRFLLTGFTLRDHRCRNPQTFTSTLCFFPPARVIKFLCQHTSTVLSLLSRPSGFTATQPMPHDTCQRPAISSEDKLLSSAYREGLPVWTVRIQRVSTWRFYTWPFVQTQRDSQDWTQFNSQIQVLFLSSSAGYSWEGRMPR